MKDGDEDLVEDEVSLNLREDGFRGDDSTVQESTAEQKVTASIPVLKSNQNSLIKQTKPFS